MLQTIESPLVALNINLFEGPVVVFVLVQYRFLGCGDRRRSIACRCG
jgi:hypothetical protein